MAYSTNSDVCDGMVPVYDVDASEWVRKYQCDAREMVLAGSGTYSPEDESTAPEELAVPYVAESPFSWRTIL